MSQAYQTENTKVQLCQNVHLSNRIISHKLFKILKQNNNKKHFRTHFVPILAWSHHFLLVCIKIWKEHIFSPFNASLDKPPIFQQK